MHQTPISKVIPEKRIVMFAPHYDDFLLGLGGYVLELKAQGLLSEKEFHILLLFSRSNYQTGSGAGNFDISLERIKIATGKRLLEDLDCLDELIGAHCYRYELFGERECMLRGKVLADSELEFPHGTYEDFTREDEQIFGRIKALVHRWAAQEDTALVFPLAIKEHIDHFITREAGMRAASELGSQARAAFYFQEDKPYAGVATQDEMKRVEDFIMTNRLSPILYQTHPQQVVDLAFKHYVSQVDDVYRKGVLLRSEQLKTLYHQELACDLIFSLG